MKRLETKEECYAALANANDLIKAVQNAGLRGVLPADPELSARCANARRALEDAIYQLGGA